MEEDMYRLGTIVVVDENPTTRGNTVSILSEAGFSVESFDDGDEAKRRITQGTNGHSVGLAIVDLHMSCVNGTAFSDWIQAFAPHVGVVFTVNTKPGQAKPLLPGYLVIPTPIQEAKDFVDEIRLALTSAAGAATSARIESKVDKLTECNERFQGKMEETIMALTGTLTAVGGTASEAKAKALEAESSAKAAQDALSKLTLTTVTQREWARAPKGARWALGVSLTLVSTLAALVTALIGHVASEAKTNTDAVPDIKWKVERQIEPALKRNEEQLAEILRRLPPPTPMSTPTLARPPIPVGSIPHNLTRPR